MTITNHLKKSSIRLLLVLIIGLLAALPAAQASGAATMISIPSIGVDAPVTPVYVRAFPNGSATWDVSGLHWNIGLLDGLGNFGQVGNTVVGAHSEGARGVPDVFYNLDAVSVGDEISVMHGGAQLRYQVVDVYTVRYNDLRPIMPTGDERLTLITCDTGSFNTANGSYNRRIVVSAVRVG